MNDGGYSDNWRLVLINFVPDVLEMSSVLHVALLVFLRLFAVLKPMSYTDVHVKMRFISIPIIWTASIFFHIINRVFLFAGTITHFYIANLFILFSFSVLPVISILIMYLILVYTLRKNKMSATKESYQDTPSTPVDTIQKKMTLVVQRVVLVLIFCYGPFVIWKVYFYFVVNTRDGGKLMIEEVRLY